MSEASERLRSGLRTQLAQRVRVWSLWIVSACVACGSTERASSDALGSAGRGAVDAASWCEIQAIFKDKCQRCHQLPAQHGAPFALMTYDDTQVRDSKGAPRYQQIASAVESSYMPPQFIELEPAVLLLSEAERKTLLAWCADDAPLVGSASCSAER